MKYPRIFLAGTNSGVGKTTITLGLILALKKRGLNVQPFKAGPDYIDPSYHGMAAEKSCRNLDTWMLTKNTIIELFERSSGKNIDISIIEGVMGLYDGIGDTDKGSSAQLAKILKTPVILIVDVYSMSRSAAAVVMGYKNFDKGVLIKGVILNNIGNSRHYNNVKIAIEKKTGLHVLGYLPKNANLTMPERHLGLIPAAEKAPLAEFSGRLTKLVEENINLDKIIAISQKAPSLPGYTKKLFKNRNLQDKITIAVAKDAAFNFYYQDNLDLLNNCGADLIEFNTLNDDALPEDADGVYIGGGFPELFASELTKNKKLRKDICNKAKIGLPIYAECGGLMYLAKDITDNKNRKFPMVGVFNVSVKMAGNLQALGYVNIQVCRNNILSKKGMHIKGHVFHWSYLEGFSDKENFAYRVDKGKTPDFQGKTFLDGLTKWNVLASYCHLHFGSDIRLAENFVKSCKAYKKTKK